MKRSDIIETEERQDGNGKLNGEAVDEVEQTEVAQDEQTAVAQGDQDEVAQDEKEIVDEVAAEIEKLRAEAERNLDNYQRAVADLANYRRRKELETSRLVKQARHAVLRQFLPVVDDFERAMKSATPEDGDASWLEGFRLIGRKLWSVLESEGVRPMESVGQPFDPNLHDAVQVDQEADSHDTVIEEYQRGYFIDDEVLRPATVKVGSADSIPTDSE